MHNHMGDPMSPTPNTAYAVGWRLGAIRVRRESAEITRQQAIQAYNAGAHDEALHLHQVADQHEERIRKYSEAIGRLQ
jgi:hypothetical protein